MIKKYRKKPIIIEAIQFFPTMKSCPDCIYKYEKERIVHEGIPSIYYGWRIDTLEGAMEVSPGDWIIKGIKGEFYPCKPDIFEKTYDEVKK